MTFADVAPSVSDSQPNREGLRALRERAEELLQRKHRIDALERELKEEKQKFRDYTMRELVEIFDDVGTDRIGIPEAGYDVVVEPYYHASISTEWPQDKRTMAFNLLEEKGAGTLIKTVITVTLNKEDTDMKNRVVEVLHEIGVTPSVNLGVHWATLSSFVREQWEKDPPGLTLEELPIIGATVGRVAKLKERK